MRQLISGFSKLQLLGPTNLFLSIINTIVRGISGCMIESFVVKYFTSRCWESKAEKIMQQFSTIKFSMHLESVIHVLEGGVQIYEADYNIHFPCTSFWKVPYSRAP